VPGGLTATANGSGAINLSWTASTDNVGVTGYRVERCQGASCTSFAQVATPTGTGFGDSGLSAGATYRYRVRATDAAGNLSGYSSLAQATTTAAAPVASFSGTPTSGTAPLTVNFTSGSTGTITSYSWSFGDGTTSTVQNPSKSYANAGSYSVSLTVTGPGGSHTSTRTGYVVVGTATTVAIADRGLMADEVSASGTSSNTNGILEPGETVHLAPMWEVTSGGPVAVTGSARISGPGSSSIYSLVDSNASYGTMASGAVRDCQSATGNCYRLAIGDPKPRPSLRWEATFTETLSNGTVVSRSLHVGKSFPDVASNDPFYLQIESLVRNNVTLGFADGTFKGASATMRAQSAMFLARAAAGKSGEAAIPVSGTLASGAYNCVSGGTSRFVDLPPTDMACKHFHYLVARGAFVSSECTATNRACPTLMSTRAGMAVMVAGAMATGGDAGVPAVGTFNDSGVARSYNCATTGGSRFTDVPASAAYCRHVNYLWARGVIDGYTTTTFAPALTVTRGQMAKFIGNAFKLSTD
jgi:PKD repeat protein